MIKKQDFWTNFILYGRYGTGKTTCGCTAPKPIALIDADNKARGQASIRNLVVSGDVDIFPLNYPLMAGNDLDYVCEPKVVNAVPEGYKAFVNLLQRILNKEQKEYATIFVDSGSRVIQHLIQLIITINGKTQMTENLWGVFYTEVANRLMKLMTAPLCFIWSFHERVIIDEATKQQTVVASIPGQMGADIGSFFNEVYNTRVDVIGNIHEYYLVTKSNAKHANRTGGDLKLNEKPDLSTILKKLDGTYVLPPGLIKPTVKHIVVPGTKIIAPRKI